MDAVPIQENKDDKIYYLLKVAVIFLIGALVVAFLLEPTPTVLSNLGAVPPFSLVDSRGSKMSLDQLKGKVWVADFMYVHCTTQCPLMTAAMAKLQKAWLGKGVYFVSFTMDPSDTPQELAKYAKQYGADTDSWAFLTGKYEDVTRLAQYGFKLPAQGGPDSDFIHSIRFTLVDKQGKIRGYYNSDDEGSLNQLNRDLWVLLAEKS